MFGNKNIIVVWVSRRQLILLGGKIAEPQSIVFPENIVADLEVLDQDALYGLIKEWSSRFPAASSELVWIFGPDVYFERVCQESEKQTWDSVVVRFLDLLPFEEVESRTYVTPVGTKVVAVNKSFYTALRRGFALQGYTTRAEIASADLGKDPTPQTLDQDTYDYIVRDLDAVEKNRLVTESSERESPHLPVTEKKKNSSLPLLITVFAVLLGILGFMILTMNR